jgi:hypothetical protein
VSRSPLAQVSRRTRQRQPLPAPPRRSVRRDSRTAHMPLTSRPRPPLTVTAVTYSCAFVAMVCHGGVVAASWVARKYPLLRLLVLAHSGGFASQATRRIRLAVCTGCVYNYEKAEHRYCRGDNGGRGCGCGHWRGSRITHKVKLAAFRCPQRRFDYEGLARAWDGIVVRWNRLQVRHG